MPDLASMQESLARVVLAGRDRAEMFTEIVAIACRALPGSDAASITLIRGRKTFTAAHYGALATHADELQYERGHGPCLDAGRAGQVFVVADMRTEPRWPEYGASVAELGVRSSLSIPLPFQTTTIGALNNYSARPSAFSADDVVLGQEIAGWVALVAGNADFAATVGEDLANMRIAMASRAVIEQAKGILMERHRLTEEQAFTALTHVSQKTNTKLRDIAERLVLTGKLHA